MYIRQRITIIRMRRPEHQPLNEELQFFGRALGLFGERDRDKSCFRIFIELLKTTRYGGLSSDEIAEKLDLTRGTVVHHLNTLFEKGLLKTEENRYILRTDNLKQLIQELRDDLNKTFDELDKTAAELDNILGL